MGRVKATQLLMASSINTLPAWNLIKTFLRELHILFGIAVRVPNLTIEIEVDKNLSGNEKVSE